ncbi:hypothetical protein [Kutzneria chonburiensis]|uniref:Mycothiol-dependent maleylpyruvate isomerase metal-binding domain-containing protein n=1 Tax=Kutzneria chonburiensis TaxID=1483604 RepID=A0ABV6MQB2_9PSEU|nr:hypothetical protein [Kutzneria chonburiensis]
MSVTADDLEHTLRLTVATLRQAHGDWEAQAGPLEWTCWETTEHIADNFFFHAAQVAPGQPWTNRSVPFAWNRQRDGGPGLVIFADRKAGPEGLIQVVDACGGMMVAILRTTPKDARAFNDSGVLTPEGFAALTVAETLLHMDDVAQGLRVDWQPPAELAAKVLDRVFPDAPTETDPWTTLLWASGRGELDGHERPTEWDYALSGL